MYGTYMAFHPCQGRQVAPLRLSPHHIQFRYPCCPSGKPPHVPSKPKGAARFAASTLHQAAVFCNFPLSAPAISSSCIYHRVRLR